MERWLPIPDYCGFYDISSEGRIRSNRPGGKIRTIQFRGDGYPLIVLHLDGKPKTWLVHRLVCRAFHGEQPSDAHEVGHRDGVRSNVREDNLRWVTKKENQGDRIGHGTSLIGAKHPRACLSAEQARTIIRRRSKGESVANLAGRYSVSHNTVRRVVQGQTYPDISAEFTAQIKAIRPAKKTRKVKS